MLGPPEERAALTSYKSLPLKGMDSNMLFGELGKAQHMGKFRWDSGKLSGI